MGYYSSLRVGHKQTLYKHVCDGFSNVTVVRMLGLATMKEPGDKGST